MPIYVNVVIFILACGIVACIIAILTLVAHGEKKLNLKHLPPLEPRALITVKEHALRADLIAVCDKMGLLPFAKVGLGGILQTKDENNRDVWHEALMSQEVDFVICDSRSRLPLIAIIPVEHGAKLEPNQDVVVRAMGKLDIPLIQLGNYNRAGLEKVIREKLAKVLPHAAAKGHARLESPEQPAPEPAPAAESQ